MSSSTLNVVNISAIIKAMRATIEVTIHTLRTNCCRLSVGSLVIYYYYRVKGLLLALTISMIHIFIAKVIQLFVQIECSADQAQVRKGLGKIAQMLSLKAELL